MNRRTNPLPNCPEILWAINVVKFLVQIDTEGGTFLQGSLKVAVSVAVFLETSQGFT